MALPPPRSHLMRWAGVIASNSPYGRDITFRPEINKGFQFAISEEGGGEDASIQELSVVKDVGILRVRA
ncbi:MAG: hypothetical protein NTY08_04740 [Proteobacteria bacterium]|nr:hypothetical protein [Pseudomonadota bacterium]